MPSKAEKRKLYKKKVYTTKTGAQNVQEDETAAKKRKTTGKQTKQFLKVIGHKLKTLQHQQTNNGTIQRENNRKKKHTNKGQLGKEDTTSSKRRKNNFANIRKKMFFNRVMSNLLKDVKKDTQKTVFYKKKKRVQKIVENCFEVKRKFFILIINRIRSLDKIMRVMKAKSKWKRLVNRTNFCDLFLGEWSHRSSSEPFFNEESYLQSNNLLHAVDTTGRAYEVKNGCAIEKEKVVPRNEEELLADEALGTRPKAPVYTWSCSSICSVRQESIDLFRKFLRNYSKKTVKQKIKLLQELDPCRVRQNTGLQGHSLACLSRKVCQSVFHHFRMLAVHHTQMRKLVRILYYAKSPTLMLKKLNTALLHGSVSDVTKVCEEIEFCYFGPEEETAQIETLVGDNVQENVENSSVNQFEEEITKFMVIAADRPNYTCICCRRTHYKNQTRLVDLYLKSETENNDKWKEFATYLLVENCFDLGCDQRICKYCYNKLEQNKMPARAVYNNLELVDTPLELVDLNTYESILIQCVHPFQAIVRMEPKIGKLPPTDLQRGLKGRVVYLPLDVKKNIETIGVENVKDEPLVILVNGVPTKNKKIWQELVDVSKVKKASLYLKENNSYYKNVLIDEEEICLNEDTETSSGQIEKVDTSRTEDIYEHYSVHPLHSKEVMGNTIELFQMKEAKGTPISVWEQSLEARCFPQLFPTGTGTRYDEHPVQIPASEYRTLRLYAEDPRFRQCIPYMFHLLFESDLSGLSYAVNHILKSGVHLQNVSAKDFMDKVHQKDNILESQLINLMACQRGTNEYWYRRHGELKCMLRNLGTPTWFLTLSCAEYAWDDLLEFLRQANSNLPNIQHKTPGELCSLDPVNVCRYFNHRFEAMMAFITNKKNPPLGEVVDFFWRKEYQARGAPHIHMLLWIKDAPKFGTDSDDVVLTFIQQYATCCIPNNTEENNLKEQVLRFQRHRCGKYCRRKYKSKDKFYTKCRFGFPRPVISKGRVNSFMSAVRHTITRKSPKNTYNLKRSEESKYINDYNPVILSMWNANMDIQYVADNSIAVARYVTSYITKSEKTELKEMWEEISHEKSLSKKLYSYSLKMLSHREIGAYECSDRLSSASLYSKSRRIIYVTLGLAATRNRVLKPVQEIEYLAQTDPESTDIVKTNMLDTYYPNRSHHLETICLYEVLQNYTFKHNITENINNGIYQIIGSEGCLVKQRKGSLINHRKLSCDTADKKEFYYLALLQLFKPWRSESELIGDFDCYEDSFNASKDSIECPIFQMYVKMLNDEIEQESRIAVEIARDSSQDSQTSGPSSQDPLGQPIVENEAANAMDEVETAMYQAQEDILDLATLENQLNPEQKQIYQHVKEQIDHGVLHDKKECSCTEFQPIRMYVSGQAGTGKSFLIKVITTYISKSTESHLSCIVTAPTGLAAHNIKGVTLHRLLMLPVEHENKLQYHKLSGEACFEVSRVVKKMKLLIIDEVSMVSNLMLAFVHLRMQQVLKTNYDVLFGGKHVMVFGDLLQLTPVKGQPVFKTLVHEDTRKSLGSIGNVNIWSYFEYKELVANMRQAQDIQYGSILQDIRIGKLTEHGKQALQSRLLTNLFPNENIVPEKIYREIAEKKSVICLMPTLRECSTFNEQLLKLENKEIIKLEAIDKIEHEGITIILTDKLKNKLDCLEKSISKTAGLEKNLYLCINCRVILRRNLNVEKGLVNGAMGKLVGFLNYQNREGVEFLQIKFDEIEEVQQVSRCSVRFLLVKDLYVRRKQFPVSLAYAVTIHKSQGLSVDCALVNIGNTVFKEGMAYVALSRVRTLSGLFLIDFDDAKISADVKCITEYNRLRRLFHPGLGEYPVFEKRVVGRKRKFHNISSEAVEKGKKQDEIVVHSKKKQNSVEQIVGFPFENSSGVNCYANVVVNVVFFLKSLQEQIVLNHENVFCSLLQCLYEKCSTDTSKLQSVSDVRSTVDVCSGINQFTQNIQQDSQEFLLYIFTILEEEGVDIDSLFGLRYKWQHQCESCLFICSTDIESERFLYLTLPNCKSVSFKQLVKNAYQNMECSQCKSDMSSTLFLHKFGKYIILMLQRCTPDGTKLETLIKDFVTSQVSISGRTFVAIAIIFHEGLSTTSGHYTVYLKTDKGWCQCNDSQLIFRQRLPRELANSYLIFLKPKV